MPFTQSLIIEVKQISGKGRGVFARMEIVEGAEIERVPVLVLPASELADDRPLAGLNGYVFTWHRDQVAIALGYGSLYNHSYTPNARYDDRTPQTKIYTAIRDIAAGEEITINYHGDPDDSSPVDCDVK